MKKLLFLSVMLLSSVVLFGQTNNLPGVLTVRDALVIYKNGFGEAKAKLADLGYEFFGFDDDNNHWAKNCEYDNDRHKAVKFGKGTSSVITIPTESDDVTITVFNQASFDKLKNQVIALGYKKNDSWGGSSGTHYDLYTKKGMVNITVIDDPTSDLRFNIHIGEDM